MKDTTMPFFKRHIILWKAMLINIILLASLLLFFYPRYYCDLDIMMQSILYGTADGKPGFYIMFSNAVVGYFLKTLVNLFPVCPWYTIFHYLCIFLALWAVLYMILKRNKGYMGIVIASIIGIFLGYECYIMPGYIRTSALLTSAAIYLLFDYIQQEKKKIITAVLGVLLGVIGSLISFQIFAMVIVVGVICLAVNGIAEGRIERTMERSGALMAIMIVLAIGLLLVDQYAYRHRGYLENTLDYRGSIEQIFGYGVPAYDEELGAEIELDEQEYELLTRGIFAPKKEEKNMDKFQYIAEQVQDVSLGNVKTFFRSIPIQLFRTGMFYCCTILGLLLLFSKFIHWKRTIVPAMLILFLVLLILYLWKGSQYSWVYAIPFYPICMFMLMGVQDTKELEPRYLAVFLTVAQLVLYHQFSSSIVSSINEEKIVTAFENREDEIDEDMDKEERKNVRYVIELNAYLKDFSVFQVYPKNLLAYDEMHIANGCYAILPEYEPYMLSESPQVKNGWVWLYKPKWIYGPGIP